MWDEKLIAVKARIGGMRDDVVKLQGDMTAIPALGPDNDGPGEYDKAVYLERALQDMGITDIRRLDAPDSRVPHGIRPNIVAVIPGEDTSRNFWIISHMDIVPPGDLDLWDSDPYQLTVDGDVIVGRGVEDNQQGITASMLLAKAVLEEGVVPPMNLALMLVSDEETGSRYGLEYILDEHADVFGPEDLILVPDYGDPGSGLIEVAEKSTLWLKCSFTGKQCHASTPEQGINSLVASAAFIMRVKEMEERFGDKDPLFNPAGSTFSPTKKDANVPNVNTIPGKDVVYIDCRVLPQYDLADVVSAFEDIGRDIAEEYGVLVGFEAVQREQAAPPTPHDAPIVGRLVQGIKAVYDTEAKPAGIGGGTVAALFRKKHIPVAVWSTWIYNAHQPNERSLISTQIGDAKVMAHVLFGNKEG